MRRQARRVACVRLLAIVQLTTLAACGGDFDFAPAAATATAANIALATATGIAGATAGATAVVASAAPIPTTAATRAGNAATASAASVASAVSAEGRATPSPSSAARTPTGDTVPYTDPANRFTFSRPRVWRDAPAMMRDLVVRYASTAPRGTFNVSASQVPTSATLDQYATVNVAEIKRDVAGYRDGPIGLQQGKLGGSPARQYDFYATIGGEQQYVAQIYCLRDSVLYVLTFITPTEMNANMGSGFFYDSAQVVVDSWRFL